MLGIENFLSKYYKEDDKILLACSTGPDSIFLLDQILKTKYKNNLIACYFNHKLRKEADEEEVWLEKLGEAKGFQVEIGEANIKEIRDKFYSSISLEELARKKRYDFFDALMHIHNSKYIITGHHLDDKIETFFHNLLRGTKLSGLVNMKEKSSCILRPLLQLEKSYIKKYLDENKIEYEIDITNEDNTITRNKIRNEIIPEFYSINSNFKKNIENTINYFDELKEFLDLEVKNFLGNLDYFEIDKFHLKASLLQKEIIRYIYYISNNKSTIGLSESNINEVIKFINGKNNKTKKDIQKMQLFKDGNKVYFKFS